MVCAECLLPTSPDRRLGEIRPVDEEVVELTILMLRPQVQYLEEQALQDGISVGQLLRHLIGFAWDLKHPQT